MEVCSYCGWPLASRHQMQVHIEIKHEDEMIVAKGITQKDGSYVWTCNKCDGPENTRNSACGYGSRVIEQAFAYELKVLAEGGESGNTGIKANA